MLVFTVPVSSDVDRGRGYEQLQAEAIRALTDAARLTYTHEDGTVERHDFADFLAIALAATAANIGGVEALLVGRPGSWEAGYVRGLLHGTVGPDMEALLPYRTEPLTITVAVDNMLAEFGLWDLYEDSEQWIDEQLAALPDDSDAEAERLTRMLELLEQQRQAEWVAYGEAFRDNLLRALDAERLRCEVRVDLNLAFDDNPFALLPLPPVPAEAWDAAVNTTPLPGSGQPPSSYVGSIRDAERAAGRLPHTRLTV